MSCRTVYRQNLKSTKISDLRQRCYSILSLTYFVLSQAQLKKFCSQGPAERHLAGVQLQGNLLISFS